MWRRLAYILIPVMRCVAALILFAAGYLLQLRTRGGWGIHTEQIYWALVSSAVVLVVLSRAAPGLSPLRLAANRLAAPVLFVASLALSAVLCGWGPEDLRLSTSVQSGLWLLCGVLLLSSSIAWESGRSVQPSGLRRRDWLCALIFFALALLARLWSLGTAVPALAFDETVPLARTLADLGTGRSPFYVDDMSMPALFHEYVRLFASTFHFLNLDAVRTAKLANVLLASASVPLFVLFVRLVAGASIAMVTGGFLILQNWHWLYSRFYYLYAGDLLWIALASLLTVAGIRSNRISLLTAAGIVAAIGVAWWKTAILAGPWVALLLFEQTLFRERIGWQRALAFALVSFVPFAVMCAPIAAEAMSRSDTVWRFARVDDARERVRERHGLTPTEAKIRGVASVFEVLQLRYGDFGRYSLRGRYPILDFVSSSLTTVGFVWSVWFLLRRRGARLCVMGFLWFMLPVVLSYPQDMPAAVPRRALGSCLFVAWMSARGAWVVGSIPGLQWRRAAVLALLVLATVLNVQAIRVGRAPAKALRLWYDDIGGSRVAILNAIERASHFGPVFYHVTGHNLVIRAAAKAFGPRIRHVENTDQLRSAIFSNCRTDGFERCTLLLEWGGGPRPSEAPDWVRALTDIVPVTAWKPGPEDPAGVPVYRVAFFALPAQAPSPAAESVQ